MNFRPCEGPTLAETPARVLRSLSSNTTLLGSILMTREMADRRCGERSIPTLRKGVAVLTMQ